MRVGLMRRLQRAGTIQTATRSKPPKVSSFQRGSDVIAPLPGEEFTRFCAEIQPTLQEWDHQPVIIETKCRVRESVRIPSTEAR
jgi:hypothetical protein